MCKRRTSGTNSWLTVWVKKAKLNYCSIMNIQCECPIVDIAVAGDKRIVEKENEKVKKFQELKQKIPRMWNTRTVREIKIVVGSFASVTKNLENWLESWT